MLNFSNRLAHSTEQKNIDIVVVAPAVAVATGVLTLLNLCAQGVTAVTRLGRRITMKSLFIRGVIELAATTTGYGPWRILVVYDKQANAAAPTATDILAADAYQSFNNLGNSKRFQTLIDKTYDCVGTAGPQSLDVKLYKKLNHGVEFNAGSAGTIADIQTGSIYALVYHTGTYAVAAPTFNVWSRVRFSDD